MVFLFFYRWNPIQYREPQAAFFGKKGISWHITVVSMKPTNDGNDNDNVEQEDGSSTDADDEEIEECPDEPLKKIFLDHAVFIHVFDQVVQDSDAVLSIIRDVLLRLKERNPMIENAFIRSDNAGCYHSAQTILNMPQLSTDTGIAIRRFDFSDPQGGKSIYNCPLPKILFLVSNRFIRQICCCSKVTCSSLFK